MTENEIEIGVIGKIIEGQACGWFLLIKEDLENTGGYILLISNTPNMSEESECYDYWAENKHSLIDMASDFKWKICWM